jgi:hypothetical protein
MKFDAQTYRVSDAGRFGTIALGVGIAGIAGCIGAYFVDPKQFFFAYLTAFAFWVSLGLGGLFFTMIHHLVDATWSVVLRRLVETLAYTLPILLIFFIPVLLGMSHLYPWTDATMVAEDHLLVKKTGFLNTGFFLLRTVIYFGIWTFLAFKLRSLSLKQDSGHDVGITKSWRKISAPGMILFALTTTFASFDWIMSLDPHWYSTIFGAYYFAGAAMSCMAITMIMVVYLHSKNVLKATVTEEHYHDIAKLMFAFIVFWAYMAFSQYFLIWYANIPEETIWYKHRWEGSWVTITMIIVIGHFCLPFLMLITRAAKRSGKFMLLAALYMLVIHYVDLYWLIFPNLYEGNAHFSWVDIVTMMAIGGPFMWYFWTRFTAGPLVPVGDPKLAASIKFVNN